MTRNPLLDYLNPPPADVAEFLEYQSNQLVDPMRRFLATAVFNRPAKHHTQMESCIVDTSDTIQKVVVYCPNSVFGHSFKTWYSDSFHPEFEAQYTADSCYFPPGGHPASGNSYLFRIHPRIILVNYDLDADGCLPPIFSWEVGFLINRAAIDGPTTTTLLSGAI